MNAADRPSWRHCEFSRDCWDMKTFLRPRRVAMRSDDDGGTRVLCPCPNDH